MKRIAFMFILALSFVLLSSTNVKAQTTILPAASTHSVQLPITLPTNCTGTNTCQFQVYRLAGTCPGTLSGSTGWTLLGTTAAQATSFLDNQSPNGQESYDAEAIPTGSATTFSGPSNCVTVNVPIVPLPPVLGTPTVN